MYFSHVVCTGGLICFNLDFFRFAHDQPTQRQDECDEDVINEIYDCANSLALAKWAGLQSGVFTEQNVSYDLTPRPDFRWSEGFPEELDVEYFED